MNNPDRREKYYGLMKEIDYLNQFGIPLRILHLF